MQRVCRGAFLKRGHIIGLTILTVFLLDRLTKSVIIGYLAVGDVIPVVPGFFDIVHVRNRGAAFGILGGGGTASAVVLAIVSALAIAVLFYLIKEATTRLQIFALSLITGGALGNLVDRIVLGEVVDFLDFHARGYHWPAFNVADSAITIGVVLALVSFYRK